MRLLQSGSRPSSAAGNESGKWLMLTSNMKLQTIKIIIKNAANGIKKKKQRSKLKEHSVEHLGFAW